jgi:hypothetical protein
MRSNHKARLLRHDAALELVLEHPRGQAILEASGGDAEHALRIIETLKAPSSVSAEVIRLPRTPILDFAEVYDQETDAGLELEQRAPFPFVLAAALGLAAWLVVAAIGFGLYELATRWPA